MDQPLMSLVVLVEIILFVLVLVLGFLCLKFRAERDATELVYQEIVRNNAKLREDNALLRRQISKFDHDLDGKIGGSLKES